MALTINKTDLAKDAVAVGRGEPDFLDGINKLLGNLNTTILSANKLLDGYNNIAEKIGPKPISAQPWKRPVAYHQQPRSNPEPAIKPQPPPEIRPPEPAEKKEETPLPAFELSEEQKTEKATKIFNELHELVKPWIPQAKFVTADKVIMYALQPDNKKKIIDEIAKKL